MNDKLVNLETTKTNVFPILLVNFIGALGYSLILPFLIVLVIKFGGNELIYGILGATYSFFQLIGAPILGRWSDSMGRKRILLLSQIGTFAAWLLFLVALIIPNNPLLNVDNAYLGAFILSLPLLMLFGARALDGITGGNISVANAYLSDISDDSNRKSNFGKMAASANLGFIIGPALAGVLGGTVLGEILPVFATMLISLIAIAVIQFYLKETNPCAMKDMVQTGQFKKILNSEQKDCFQKSDKQKLNLIQTFQLPNVGFTLILYFLIFLAFNFFYVSFPVHAVQTLEWDLFKLGIYFSFMGTIMVIVQGSVLNFLSKRFSEVTLIIAGSLFLMVAFFLYTQSNMLILYLAIILFAGGNGIMWPSFLSVLAKIAGDEHQGTIQGYASSTGSLASIIGLISGGFIYSFFGTIIFVLPAILMIVISGLSFRFRQIS